MQSEQMAQLFFLRSKIGFVVGIRCDLYRQSLDDLYMFQTLYLFGIVRQKPELFDPIMVEDEFDDFIGAFIGGEAQLMIGFDGIVTLVLECVGIDFVEQTDIAPLLPMIDQHPAFRCDQLQSKMKLLAAVTLDRSKSITCQTLGVHSDNRSIRKIIGKKCQMFFLLLFKGLDLEGPVLGGQCGDLGYLYGFHERIILY